MVDRIEDGVYHKHFDTNSLQMERKRVRSDRQELKIRRWSADHGYNGNDIISAYDLYLPGVSLNDNPKLKTKIEELETSLDLGFFELADFEDSLLDFFKSMK